MTRIRLLVSTAALGLGATLAQGSFAQPEGKGQPAGPKQAAPKQAAPDEARPPSAKPGLGGPLGKRGGPTGEPGPERKRADMPDKARDAMGRPGLGKGRRGPPLGIPGRRFEVLEEKEKAGRLSDQEKAQLERMRERREKYQRLREERMKRLTELEEKKQKGTLSDEEQAELEKFEKIKERHRALKEKRAKLAKTRAERRREARRRAIEKAKPRVLQAPAVRVGLHKHAKRQALLERAREVAEAEGRDELVSRIDKLMEKENKRHQKWLNATLPRAQGKAAASQGDKP